MGMMAEHGVGAVRDRPSGVAALRVLRPVLQFGSPMHEHHHPVGEGAGQPQLALGRQRRQRINLATPADDPIDRHHRDDAPPDADEAWRVGEVQRRHPGLAQRVFGGGTAVTAQVVGVVVGQSGSGEAGGGEMARHLGRHREAGGGAGVAAALGRADGAFKIGHGEVGARQRHLRPRRQVPHRHLPRHLPAQHDIAEEQQPSLLARLGAAGQQRRQRGKNPGQPHGSFGGQVNSVGDV